MADKLPTVWPVNRHTLAKHAILERYLKAWFPILSHQSAAVGRGKKEILFIDGFAGPGVYSKGEPGSPIISLRAARDHSYTFPYPVRFLFIEKDSKRFARLRGEVDKELIVNSSNVRNVELRKGDCDTILTQVLDQHTDSRVSFGPALAFLDQFGYGAVSLSLISKIMQFGQCEVFSYIDYKNMNRWIGERNRTKRAAFDRAFGGSEWERCIDLPEAGRRSCLLELYKAALKTRAGVKYVKEFLMFDENSTPLYWLVFCTNNLRGLEEMKKAMWKVDETGEFRFSDHDAPGQLDFLKNAYSQEWLATVLREHLAGRKMTCLEVKEYVLNETPCVVYKEALRQLENDEDLVPPVGGNRRKGDFADDNMHLEFRKKRRRLF